MESKRLAALQLFVKKARKSRVYLSKPTASGRFSVRLAYGHRVRNKLEAAKCQARQSPLIRCAWLDPVTRRTNWPDGAINRAFVGALRAIKHAPH